MHARAVSFSCWLCGHGPASSEPDSPFARWRRGCADSKGTQQLVEAAALQQRSPPAAVLRRGLKREADSQDSSKSSRSLLDRVGDRSSAPNSRGGLRKTRTGLQTMHWTQDGCHGRAMNRSPQRHYHESFQFLCKAAVWCTVTLQAEVLDVLLDFIGRRITSELFWFCRGSAWVVTGDDSATEGRLHVP